MNAVVLEDQATVEARAPSRIRISSRSLAIRKSRRRKKDDARDLDLVASDWAFERRGQLAGELPPPLTLAIS